MKKLILIFGLIGILIILNIQAFAQNPELTLQTGHSGAITNFAFSFDGKYLASVGKDNIIILWDFNLGKQLKILKGHNGKISSIHFLNKSNNLISADENGKIIYWDIKSGENISQIELQKPVYSIDISNNDSLLAIGGCFSDIKIYNINQNLTSYKNISVWDKKDSLRYIRRPKLINGEKIYLKKTACFSVLFSKNNNEIFAVRATVQNNKEKRENLFDKLRKYRQTNINETTATIQTTANDCRFCEPINCSVLSNNFNKIDKVSNNICFSKNYENIYMSILPSKIISYNISKNKTNFTRPGNFKTKNFIETTVNANDSIYASLNDDGIIYLWKNKGQYFKTINQNGYITTTITFHPNKSNLLVLGDDKGAITIYNITSGIAIRKLESGLHPITAIEINNSGTIISIGSKDNLIRTFELENKISAQCLNGHNNTISSLNFISDSSLSSTSHDNRICFWDVKNGILAKNVKGNSNPALASAIINFPILSLFINPITTFFYANTFLLHKNETLNTTSYNKKEQLIATGGYGFNKGLLYKIFIPRIFPIHIIDVKKMSKTGKLKAHYLSVNSIDFNNSGTILASCGKDFKPKSIILRKAKENWHSMFPTYYSLKIWDLKKQRAINTFENPYEIKALKFNCTNDSILFSDSENNLVIFDYKNDSAKKITEGCEPLLFDNNGENIFFQNKSNSLIRWNLKHNSQVNLFAGHNNLISSSVIFPNGKQIATASLDGTVKIWDIEKGKEIATLYAINNDDYIIKTPDYFYYSTKNAKKEIGFTFGIKFYPFEQFDLQYNRPDIVLARLGIASEEMIKAYNLAYNKRLKKMGFSEDMFANDFHLPDVIVKDIEKIPVISNQQKFNFNVIATDNKYNLNRINVWVNNVPLYGVNGINLNQFQQNKIEKNISVNLSMGINKIQVSCLNQKGVESLKESFEITYYPNKIEKPNLYVIAIGASEYRDKEWNLNYATKDANDFADLLNSQKNIYENIYIDKITNENVTISNVNNIKQRLNNTKVDDVVVVFYAGHGLLDDSLNYYLATYNINFNKPSENGLKYEDLDVLLDSIPARNKVLFIDACHSGEVDKESKQQLVADNTVVEKDIVFRGVKPRGYNKLSNVGFDNSFELMKEMFSDLRKGTGAVVVSSAGGGEYAFEGENWKNGVFTYSLINGIKSFIADKNKDNKITVSELQEYIMNNVQKLTNGQQKPTMRQENIDNDFVVWRK